MNHYGNRALKHWQRHLPTRFAQIREPQTFFTQLGEQVAAQVEELTLQLAGDDQPAATGEPASFMEKAGRMNAAKQAAEEQILAELVLLPSETELETEPEMASPTH